MCKIFSNNIHKCIGTSQYCHENEMGTYSRECQFVQNTTRYILIYFYKHAHSTEATTQPYVASTEAPETNKPNYYSYYQKKNDYSTTTTTQSTMNPYKYYYHTTKQTELTEKSTEATQSTPTPIFKFSTTKNPYDFNDFTTKSPKLEPKRGFLSKDELDGYFRGSTTKSPFPDKGIKSVFKIGTYYSQAKSSDNSIRPDANSQQVQIEPARLVFSYQRNLTSGEIIRTQMCQINW